jgi:hypothetical protein
VLPVERDGRSALEGALGEDGGAPDILLFHPNPTGSSAVTPLPFVLRDTAPSAPLGPYII